MCIITGSIVTYRNELEILRKAISSFLNTGLNVKLFVIDNSPSKEIESLCQDGRIDYIFNNKNLGFGTGHNIAIRKSMGRSQYHLVLNPDIFFEGGTLEKCYDFMENNREAGLLMPKICSFDESIQYLCKLLPTPFDLFIRRINSKTLKTIFRNRLQKYELKFTGYDRIMNVPHLSGCFMFIRQDIFKKVGIFDESFFMYLEDVDLSRRIHRHYKTIYHPEITVYHQHAKHSYGNARALKHHVFSAIKYFNKWHWFFDEERQRVNKKILNTLSKDING